MWLMMVAYYKVNYLPVGVRIWFRVIFGFPFFGARSNISNVKVAKNCPKMVFCGKMAITTFKLIQNAKFGGVLEIHNFT